MFLSDPGSPSAVGVVNTTASLLAVRPFLLANTYCSRYTYFNTRRTLGELEDGQPALGRMGCSGVALSGPGAHPSQRAVPTCKCDAIGKGRISLILVLDHLRHHLD